MNQAISQFLPTIIINVICYFTNYFEVWAYTAVRVNLVINGMESCSSLWHSVGPKYFRTRKLCQKISALFLAVMSAIALTVSLYHEHLYLYSRVLTSISQWIILYNCSQNILRVPLEWMLSHLSPWPHSSPVLWIASPGQPIWSSLICGNSAGRPKKS